MGSLADNDSFTIVGDQLRTNRVLDYETKPSYSIGIRSTDADGMWIEKDFTIHVVNLNEGPTAISLSARAVHEGVVGIPVGTFSTADYDVGDMHTYRLVAAC